LKTLRDIADQLSDEFMSTFSVQSDNQLVNMLYEEETYEVDRIVRKYLPTVRLKFTKGKQVGSKSIYLIEAIKTKDSILDAEK
jgi:hypothetical protein